MPLPVDIGGRVGLICFASWNHDRIRCFLPDCGAAGGTGANGAQLTSNSPSPRAAADCEARHLRSETLRKYRLDQREMVARFGVRPVSSLGIEELSEYRESWTLAPATARHKIERLRSFFKFCIERGWVEKNPAALLKHPRTVSAPSVPFTEEELEKIMAAMEEFPDTLPGRRKQLRAFVVLLRYSGLRIQDVIRLTMDKISGGKLMLYTQKMGQAVWVPLPDFVVKELEGLGHRPFWNGEGTIKTFMGNWRRTLARPFKRAGVVGYAHRFRRMFSVNLLTRGVSIEDAAVLLGHNSIRITEKHNAQ
jgi:integrase/recombinase XerD